MTADEYNDHDSEEYDSDEDSYGSDEDSSMWDLTGIYRTDEEPVPVKLPQDVSEERRRENSDRRSSPFSDRRRGDRRRLSRTSLQGGKQSGDPMNIYLREMGSLTLLSHEEELKLAQMMEEGRYRIQNSVLSTQLALPVLLELVTELKEGGLRIFQVLHGISDSEPAEIEREKQAFYTLFEQAVELDKQRGALLAELGKKKLTKKGYEQARQKILDKGAEIAALYNSTLINQEYINSIATGLEDLSKRFRQVLVEILKEQSLAQPGKKG